MALPPPGRLGLACRAALGRLCRGARRVSEGDCLVCAGQHRGALEAAWCTDADISRFCVL